MHISAAKNDVLAVDAAWTAFEQRLRAFGERIRELTPDDARARYEGYRAALALLSDNYISQLYAEPTRPELLPYLGLISNYAGPAPDMNYYLVLVEPGASYRVRGSRGDARIIDLQQLTGWYGRDPREQIRTVSNQAMDDAGVRAGADGRLDFIFGPSPPEDGRQPWWKLEAGVKALLFREIFTDYATQRESLVLHFERIDGVGERDLSAADGARRLQALARSIDHYEFTYTLARALHQGLGSNRFRVEDFGSSAGQSDQAYIQTHFEIPADHALVGEWPVPPASSYWSFSLYTEQYQTLDFVARQTGLNDSQAYVQDGLFRFIVADFDPGVANWLDVDGHRTGLLLLRAKQAAGTQPPAVRLVPRSKLGAALNGMAPMTPAQRQTEIALRRRHYQERTRR